jgi:hypothetical protein
MRSGINLFDINTKDTFFQEFADSKKIFETQKNLDRANIEYEMQRMGLELRQVKEKFHFIILTKETYR